MSEKLLTVSPSPHIKSPVSAKSLMYWVVIAMAPAALFSFYVFGLGSVIVMALSVGACILFEFLIQKFIMKTKPTISDGSALVTGMLLAFNLPSNLPWWIILIGAAAAIGVGKLSFGGLGKNPFNPALVGRVFLLISFPVQMTSWPKPVVNALKPFDAETGATPLAIVKEGFKEGSLTQDQITKVMEDVPSYLDFFIGTQAGCTGEVSAVLILLGLIIMLVKKVVTWHIPVSFLGSMAAFAGVMWLISGQSPQYDPLFHLLAGGAMLGAVFMATDYVTSPMTKKGMLIYGVGCGVITIIIRFFGAYPEGVSFAILIMNAFTPLINKYVKPKRFGR